MAPADRDEIRAAVAARYAGLARAVRAGQAITDGSPDGGCCGAPGYPDTGGLPEAAVRGSLGCGNPVAVADLRLARGLRRELPRAAARRPPGHHRHPCRGPPHQAERLERGAQAGCIAGAPSFTEYRGGLARAGFTSITITPAQQAGDGVHSAIIRAVKP